MTSERDSDTKSSKSGKGLRGFRNRNTLLALALLLLAAFQIWRHQTPASNEPELLFSTFRTKLETPAAFQPNIPLRIELGAGSLAEIQGQWKGGATFTTVGPVGPELLARFATAGLPYEIVPSKSGGWLSMIGTIGAVAVMIGLFLLMSQLLRQGGPGAAMRFGKSKAKLVTQDQRKTTFADVAGIDEARGEVEEIIDFLRDPHKFTRLGGRIPKGVLMMGPPGTGKTLLARAIAGEAGVPFFSMSGSDFIEMFVGVGASRVRSLFEDAKKNSPCIIFIDEIDAVGRQRGSGLGGGHDEREQTLNQLLVEMDGFEINEGIILIAATNRPDVLDPALLRPGRFDRRMIVNQPDIKGRFEILKLHTRKTPMAADVDLAVIARGTSGFVGADLANLVNEAALGAAGHDKDQLGMHDFELAKDKVLMGPEQRSMVISEADRKATAYYEAGHAVVGRSMKGCDPIHKVTIIPRGRTVGLTQQLPAEDKLSLSKVAAEDQIAMAMGGRVAEEHFLGKVTTGAANDIRRATALARRMVCEWGMSDLLGPLYFEKESSQVFLGRDISATRSYSDKTAGQIDAETRRIVNQNESRARRIVLANLDKVKRVAEALLARETIGAADLDLLMAGGVPE